MLVFTGRLALFCSLLVLRVIESLLSLTIRAILFSLGLAWKNFSLLIVNFQSSFLHSEADI